MKRIKEWLIQNPIEKTKVEQALFEIAINFYHIFSLLWSKTTRKYTKEFVIYKTQSILELFVSSLPDTTDIEYVSNRIKDGEEAVEKDKMTLEDMIDYLGAEIDNFPGNQYGIGVDLKIAFLFKALETIGISKDQIFEKYQN